MEGAKHVTKYREIISSKKKRLRPAGTLFYYYMEETDKLGRITAQKSNLARIFDVNERTVANWLYALRNENLIKYKYSGKTMLNPDMYFFGSDADYEQAKNEYAQFKSDI